jgi:hypothetical protein
VVVDGGRRVRDLFSAQPALPATAGWARNPAATPIFMYLRTTVSARTNT